MIVASINVFANVVLPEPLPPQIDIIIPFFIFTSSKPDTVGTAGLKLSMFFHATEYQNSGLLLDFGQIL